MFSNCNLREDSTKNKTEPIGINIVNKNKKLTHLIMVYLDGDNDLEYAAIKDINEMESVDLSDSDVKIITLVDRIPGYDSTNGNWSDTRLYEIKYDKNGQDKTIISEQVEGMGLSINSNTELNMADPDTLSDFVAFSKEYYKADNYSLVLWNHGSGWRSLGDKILGISKGICLDDTSGYDILNMSEVSDVLRDQDLGVLGFDACLMGMLEVGYELKDSARYMVASEEEEPGDGWDYEGLLKKFILTDKSPLSLSKAILESYKEFYNNYTMSIVDLGLIDPVITSLNTFTSYLGNIDRQSILNIRESATSFNSGTYIDLYQFVSGFPQVSGSSGLLNSIDAYVVDNYNGYVYRGFGGVSIYFPTSKDDYEMEYYNEDNIDLPGVSTWDEFIKYSL